MAAKAVSRDASYCIHQKMCSITENMTFAGMRIPMSCIQNDFAVHVTEHLRHACLPHVFHSALMFFFHVLLLLHVRELFYLVNNAPRDPNIYWGLCKLYVWQSSCEVPRCRDTPLFIHTSAWVVSHSSNQCLYNGTMTKVPTLSVSVLPCLCFQGHRTQKRHPLIFHLLTTGRAAAAGNTRQMFPYLKKGEFIRVTKRLMGLCVFQNKQALHGLYHSKRACKSWIVYDEEFYRKPELTLHHSGFKSSVTCVRKV